MSATPTHERAAAAPQQTAAHVPKNQPNRIVLSGRFNHKKIISNQTLLAISEEFPAYAATLGAVHSSGSKRWRIACPLPEHDDRNPSFTIFESRRGGYLAKCSCGFAGDVVTLARAIDKSLTFRTAVEKIAQAIDIKVELVDDTPERRAERKQTAERKTKEAEPPPLPELPADFDERHRKARARLYQSRQLQERAAGILGEGITPELIQELTCSSDALGWMEGKLAYLYEHGVKIRNPDGAAYRFHWAIGNAAFPWRWHLAARPEVKEIFLCESESDAVALIAAGLENLFPRNGTPASAVIAIPGAGNFAEGWARLFKGKRVTLCFDWDGKSDSHLTKTARLLSRYASRVATPTPAHQ